MVVAVSYCYPPLRYPRSIQVARLLAQFPSREVVVVCGREDSAGDATLAGAYPDGGRRIVRVPWSDRSRRLASLHTRLVGDGLLIPDQFRPWQRDAAKAMTAAGLLQRSDVLVTFGQPMSDHLHGLRLARRRGVPWVAHFSDPWLDNPFVRRGPVARGLNARLQRLVIERADAVVFTSAETIDLVFARYPAPLREKAHVVPHAFDEALYPADRRRDALVVRYIGNFYGDRGPGPLLAALRRLAATQPDALVGVRIELVGGTQHPIEVDALAGLPHGLVTIRGPVDYIESLALMRASAVLLVLDAPGEHSVFLPSKLVEYAGARRPIVAISPEGAATELTRRLGGWTADPANVDAAAAALAEGIATARRPEGADWGNEAVRDAYSLAAVADAFRGAIDAASRRSRSRKPLQAPNRIAP